MKKLGAILLGLGLVTSSVLGAAVSSVNAVGYVNKPIPAGQWVLTTCNFQKVGGGTNTLLDAFGTNQLAQSDLLGLCDLVILFDPNVAKYQTYAQWTDGQFYLANDGGQWGAGIVSNPPIPVGTAMWVVPAGNQVGTKNKTMAGEVVSIATQTVSIVKGWQLLGYPLTCDQPLQSTGLAASGAAKNDLLGLCDLVIVWNGSAYQTYALWTDNTWYKANDGGQWGLSIPASNSLHIAEGFWYIAQNNMTWTEPNPYINNLH